MSLRKQTPGNDICSIDRLEQRSCARYSLAHKIGDMITASTFLFAILLIATNLNAQTQQDFSAPGRLKVETINFTDTVDKSRVSGEAVESTSRPSRFPRLRRNSNSAATTTKINERRVPIKVHAPIDGGPYPIIVISHGAGGNWDTHYAQAQHFASHGYVVLCMEHVGSNTEKLRSGLRLLENINRMIRDSNEVLGRPKDVSFAIDQATAWNSSHEKLKGRLDLNHIGILGHSFGAYTTMVICGMRPALDWLEPPVAPGKGVGPDLSDARISCGIALSPQGANEPFFIEKSMASLSKPLMGISGSEDKQQGGLPPMTRYQSFSLWPENRGLNKFVWLSNANHLDFTDSTGGEQQGMRSANRDDVQKIVRAASLMFFDLHLRKNNSSMENLTTSGLEKYLHGAIDSVEVRSK